MPDQSKDQNEDQALDSAGSSVDEAVSNQPEEEISTAPSYRIFSPGAPFVEDPEEALNEMKSLPREIMAAALLAEEEAEKATLAATNANLAAKTVFLGDYSQELISEKIRQARIDLTQKAAQAAQAALAAQESAREATAAAIHRAEEDAATALREFHEAEKELLKIRSLTEKAEETALEAKDAAALAEKMAATENQKSEACKNALKAAVILVNNAETSYKEADALLNRTREQAIEAEKRLNAAKQAALSANLEAKALLGKIEAEESPKSTPAQLKPAESSALRKFLRGLWGALKLVFVAALIALLLRTYVFDITRVVGSSMAPALTSGDDLFTSKISYYLDEPQRGDIVIIDAPDKNGEYYVKRIIGLPNEEIMIQNGLVYIDGVLLDEPYLADTFSTNGDTHLVIESGAYFVMGDNRGDSHDSRDQSVGAVLKDQIRGKAMFRIYPWDSFGPLT